MELESKIAGLFESTSAMAAAVQSALADNFAVVLAALSARPPQWLDTAMRLSEHQQLPKIASIVLAVGVLMLFRRIRRDRAAMRAMLAELEQHRVQFATFTRQNEEMQNRVAALGNDLSDVRARQRSMEARVGKPDPKLAAAMARAGTRHQHMVDCGLSHSEVHLLESLTAAQRSESEQRL